MAKRIVEETPNAILANQYHNPANPESHYLTTGPEIWEQTQGRVTDVIIGMGTGGTITGVGRFLKEKNPNIRIVGVDVEGSILKALWENQGQLPPGVEAHPYKVEGIGEDFLPSTLDLSVIDEVIQVDDKESFLWTRRLVREEGIFAGGSSGAALAATVRYCRRLTPERLVVVIFPDSGSRYLSKVFDDNWMRENGFLETEWGAYTVQDALRAKSLQGVITARPTDRMTEVIATMKRHDISQMPVVDEAERLVGLVTEVDLLKHMLAEQHEHTPDETIAPIVGPPPPTFPPYALLDEVLPVLLDRQVVVVVDGQRPIGILTKIDVLDFIAQAL